PPAVAVKLLPLTVLPSVTFEPLPSAARLTAPAPAVIAPDVVSEPVFEIVTLPPPASLTPLRVSVAAVSVSEMLPAVVLVALKLPTVLAPPSVVPPAELVVGVP